jgi:hypothetical protein
MKESSIVTTPARWPSAAIRSLDFDIAAYTHGDRLDRQCSGRPPRTSREKISAAGRRVGIEQNASTFDARCNLLEEVEPLTAQASLGLRKSRNVAAGA